jgi:phosphoglycerate dehydrogenase-like enzyme
MTVRRHASNPGSALLKREDGTMNRLQVLFLPPPPAMRHPWMNDVLEAVSRDHNLALCDYRKPFEPQFQNIDVVIDFGGSMGTRPMADAAASVKLWQVLGNGIDHFDLEYWRAKNIPVANCPGELTGVALAELVILFMLQLSRGWHVSQKNLHDNVMYAPCGSELLGRTLGLVGFGGTGRQVAKRAVGFGLRVIAIDVRQVAESERAEFGLEWARGPEALDELIQQSDFVSLHLHLTPETRHIMDNRRLALMKSGAFLINVSRGALVDEAALVHALRTGQIAGAGLDAFSKEPPGPDHPLLQFSNVVATPHVAGQTYGTSKRRAAFAAENVNRIARGEKPLSLIEKRENVAEFRDFSEFSRRLAK